MRFYLNFQMRLAQGSSLQVLTLHDFPLVSENSNTAEKCLFHVISTPI